MTTGGPVEAWLGEVPTQHVPEQSSEDRTHVMDESCWCGPEVTREPYAIRHREAEADPAGS